MADRHTDLPLFAWKPPCVLIAFPLGKRVGVARSIATAIQIRPDNLREAYWQRQAKRLHQELKSYGYGQTAIDAELEAFRSAVLREMMGQSSRSRGGTPGDAA